MDGQTFLQGFTDHYEAFKDQNKSIDNLIDEISYYESFIPEFFSRNGEAEGIKDMYSKIHVMMEEGTEKTVQCVDISKSNEIYTEYVEGMIKFINDIKGISSTGATFESFEEKFENAKSKDHIFIESLYDGSINAMEDMKLSEVVENVEFLIDFIPTLKTMKTNCCMVKESVEGVKDENIQKLLNDCTTMLCESVNNFCYHTIKSVIDSYTLITESLNDDGTNEQEEIPFKLFF